MSKLIILISGTGTNLQAIIDACINKIINATVTLVISNKENAGGLEKAKINNIDTYCSVYNKNQIMINS